MKFENELNTEHFWGISEKSVTGQGEKLSNMRHVLKK